MGNICAWNCSNCPADLSHNSGIAARDIANGLDKNSSYVTEKITNKQDLLKTHVVNKLNDDSQSSKSRGNFKTVYKPIQVRSKLPSKFPSKLPSKYPGNVNSKNTGAKNLLFKTSFGHLLGSKISSLQRKTGYREKPETTKNSGACYNSKMIVGHSCMTGWKETMEDVPVARISLRKDPKTSYFAVFDGHRGSTVSAALGESLHTYIIGNRYYSNGDWCNAIISGFNNCERYLRTIINYNNMCGSCATICFIRNKSVICGNVGDSRIIGGVKNKENKTMDAVEITIDHKPNDPIERARVEKAGGYVEMGRINGQLAVSRSMGDFDFKQNPYLTEYEQLVSAYPDVYEWKIKKKCYFIMLGSDGIFDVVSNQDVIDFIVLSIANGDKPEKISENLMDHCMAKYFGEPDGSHDNMSVIIVCFLHNKPYEDLVKKCKKIVRKNDVKCTRKKELLSKRSMLCSKAG